MIVYKVLDWPSGSWAIHSAKVLKKTDKQVTVERCIGSSFAVRFTVAKFDREFSPTREEAIRRWRIAMAETAFNHKEQIAEIEKALESDPPEVAP